MKKILPFAIILLIFHFPYYTSISENYIYQIKADINPANFPLVEKNTLIYKSFPITPKVISVTVTAYSSTVEETDSSPFITASGTYVKHGVIACNFLKFGTKVTFPELFKEKVFIVEDRLAPKNRHKVDIWFPTKDMALKFGVKRTEMIILGM